LLETMQVGIKFTISFIWLLEIPVRTRTILEYYTTTSKISENNKLLCNY
jgi:hypothetical protein